MLAVGCVVSAFVGAACTITTDDPTIDDTAGTGGQGTAGAATGGSSTAGSGTAGSHAGTAGGPSGGAGPVPFQCDPAGDGGAQGDANTCEPVDPTDKCEICIQDHCCAQYGACYATDPGNQCGWGGPATIDGQPNEGGELACVQICLKKAVDVSGTAPSSSDVETCAANCATTLSNGATKECGSVIGLQTNEMIACLQESCSLPCFGAE